MDSDSDSVLETAPPLLETMTVPSTPVIVYKRPAVCPLPFLTPSPLIKRTCSTSTQTSNKNTSTKYVQTDNSLVATVPESPTPIPLTIAPIMKQPKQREPYEGIYQTRWLKDFHPGHNWYGYEMYEYRCDDGSINYIWACDGAVREPYAYWVYFTSDSCPEQAYFLTYPGTPEWDQANMRWNEVDQYLKKTRYRDSSLSLDAFAQRRIYQGLMTMQLRPPEAKGEPLQPIPYELRPHPAHIMRRIRRQQRQQCSQCKKQAQNQ